MLYTKEARVAGQGNARCDDRALTRQAAPHISSTIASRPKPQAGVEELHIRTTGGKTVCVRIATDDPHWREKALANLDPLSPEAFAIRKAPQTAAEVAAWAEYCRKQDLIDEVHALAAGVRELKTALRELRDFA
jgi:hypothetical protein